MTKLFAIVSTVFAMYFHPAVANAQSGDDKVHVTAIADVSAIQPGKPFWIAFKFTIEPSWHIYWKNPGDSGLATQVKLSLPDGLTAGEIQFPIPQRLVQPGDVVIYGYENQVTLLAEITPKKDLSANGSVKISAQTTWLVCKDDCMPGASPVSIELPVADKSVPANEDDFKQWTAQLPMQLDPADVSKISVNGQFDNGNGHADVEITWKTKTTDLHFIPGVMRTGEISNITESSVTDPATGAVTSKLGFDVKNKTDKAPVTGLITFTKPDGTKAALEISMPREIADQKK